MFSSAKTTAFLLIFGLLSQALFAAGPTTHHLGPTGLLGTVSKTILSVTKVDQGSPADGKIQVGDQIVGAGSETFHQDARRELAEAIDAAETEKADGKLTLILKNDKRIDLQLDVLGAYSPTAPYNCPKTDAIITQAADALVKAGNLDAGACKTAYLGLLATGEKKYIDAVKEVLPRQKWVHPNPEDFEALLKGEKDMGYVGWYWGYNCITLAEYYLLTGDASVLPALKIYAVSLAKGQDAGGLWGHRMASPKRYGRLPGYAQMNQPSLSCFMGMLLAKKCGIEDPALDKGIAKTYAYFESFVGRGAFPYGVHGPNTRTYNNNGTSGSAALCMAFSDNSQGAKFFSQLAATSYDGLENGHASTFFNPLWTPLGTNLSGPEVTRLFFQKSRWLLTMYRAWDGSFSRFGGNSKPGPQAGVALLTYCLPRKALYITGKNADTSIWVDKEEAEAVVERSKTDYNSMNPEELIALFGHPIPQVTRAAIWTLREKEGYFVPALKKMMKDGTKTEKISALGYFGYKCPKEIQLEVLKDMAAILQDTDEDPEVRAAAAASLCWVGEEAYPYYSDMVRMVVEDEPSDTFRDIDWSLAKSINTLCKDPFKAGIVKNKALHYQAAVKLAEHKRQHVRAEGLRMLAGLPAEDFPKVADVVLHVIEDKDPTYHSYHSPGGPVGAGISILADLNIKEGIQYTLDVLDMESGKWGFKVRMVCAVLPKYGANAKMALEKLKADPRLKTVEQGKFRGIWQRMVQAIETDTHPPELISLEEAEKAGE